MGTWRRERAPVCSWQVSRSERRGQKSPQPTVEATDHLTTSVRRLLLQGGHVREQKNTKSTHMTVLSWARLELPNTCQVATKERDKGSKTTPSVRIWKSSAQTGEKHGAARSWTRERKHATASRIDRCERKVHTKSTVLSCANKSAGGG